MGSMDQETNANEDGEKEEVGDEETYSDEINNGGYTEEAFEDNAKVNYSPPDDNVKTYTAVNQDDTREDNETIVERSDNTNEKD